MLILVFQVTNRVGAVSKEWRWAMIDPHSLAVIIPVDQNPKNVSRERFVSLLEYCEEELGMLTAVLLL
ncbi:hypothetical protein Y032_0096g2916 [Ancylostoma ceylanicum]|uniref:Uncharacterized protein n=1 Tax=Ancylostoma ceylanicum TaxID=53326 RepID=A0A016TKH2_9BILA|nr:hypothetical protein Y032_0096g2916 [Ancylostoma ceylanicum]